MAEKSLFTFAEAALKTDKNTVRIHTPKNKEVIHDSVEETGFLRSIVIDEDNQVLAGKGVTEEAAKRGANILIVDVDDPNTLVAVRRKGLTEFQKGRAMLYDNRGSDTSRNNKTAISRLASEHPEQRLLRGIWGEREEQKLLRAQADAQPLAAGGVEDDEFAKGSTVEGTAQDSSIRMIPIFATTDTHPDFVRKVRKMGQQVFDTTTITDTVFAIITRAYAEWVEVEKEDDVQSEIGALAGESNTTENSATA